MRRRPRRRYPSGVKQVQRALKVGRNAPCPCGSGKKFKRCCESRVRASLDLMSGAGDDANLDCS